MNDAVPVPAPHQIHRQEEEDSTNVETSDGVCFWLQSLVQFKQHQAWQPGFDYLKNVQAAVRSPSFCDFCHKWGMSGAKYQQSRFCARGQAVCDRFLTTIRSLTEIASLAVVFHGTREDRINNILEQGLDPSLRNMQKYGPGEYFSINPWSSVSFCRTTQSNNPFALHSNNPQPQQQVEDPVRRKMIVFLVVLPMDSPSSKTTQRQRKNCPPEYIVVPNNLHQLPLGVVSFTPGTVVSPGVKTQELQQLGKRARESNQATAEAALRAKIIQHMIQDQLNVAVELYERNQAALTDVSKREIATFALRKTNDSELVEIYFPGALTKKVDHDVQNFDQLQQEAAAFKKRIKDTAQSADPPAPPAPPPR